MIRQTAKLNSSPNFPAIRYVNAADRSDEWQCQHGETVRHKENIHHGEVHKTSLDLGEKTNKLCHLHVLIMKLCAHFRESDEGGGVNKYMTNVLTELCVGGRE